ncbi:MAG: rRNA (Adenine-N6-)-methyltransferase [Parcubacteria group bacterium GW2011_GWA1_47_8]|nr:MAG: rRNA (Adenine-N6-)-methyltransferase [Parcubacteria group bacterium GW2011_GWA1_47_8]
MDLPNFTDPETNVRELGIYEGMRIADLGAGVGAYMIPLARRVGATGRVYAVEVQKEFLANIKSAADKEGLSNVEVLWGDIEHLGGTTIQDASIDAVVISNVLFQAEDKPGLLGEAKRILKSGGKLLLVDWKESFGNVGPTKDAVVSITSARTLCDQAGFVEKREFSAGAHHYGIVLFKP